MDRLMDNKELAEANFGMIVRFRVAFGRLPQRDGPCGGIFRALELTSINPVDLRSVFEEMDRRLIVVSTVVAGKSNIQCDA